MEFALIAPLLIGLVLGVFQIGLYATNYAAMRSLTSDVSRYAVVEYQKDNAITVGEIQSSVHSLAAGAPYNLDNERLDVAVTELTSEIGDARKFNIALTYAPNNLVSLLGVDALELSYARSVYVRKVTVVS